MSKFLQGEASDCFAWLDPSSLDTDKKQLEASSKTRLCTWTSLFISSILCVAIGAGGILYVQGKSGSVREMATVWFAI